MLLSVVSMLYEEKLTEPAHSLCIRTVSGNIYLTSTASATFEFIRRL